MSKLPKLPKLPPCFRRIGFGLARPLVIVVLLCGAGLSTGCASDKAVIAQAAEAHKEIQPAVIEDPQLAAYVQKVGDRVVDVARQLSRQGFGQKGGEDNSWMFQDIRFHLVNSKTLNAFTTGGQHVYLYSELMRNCATEDEFAAVVGHEFAHIYRRHVHNGMNRQYAILGVAAAAAAGGAVIADEKNRATWAGGAGGLALVGGQLIGLGYSRGDEADADHYGFEFYIRAGWDPQQFGNFFKTLADKGGDSGPGFLSSHPTLSSRVEAAKKRAANLPEGAEQWRRPNVVSQAEFDRLKQRTVAVGARMPSDASLEQAQRVLAAFPSCLAPQETPAQAKARRELLQEYSDEQQDKDTGKQAVSSDQPKKKRKKSSDN